MLVEKQISEHLIRWFGGRQTSLLFHDSMTQRLLIQHFNYLEGFEMSQSEWQRPPSQASLTFPKYSPYRITDGNTMYERVKQVFNSTRTADNNVSMLLIEIYGH